jgi:hypothetical protein
MFYKTMRKGGVPTAPHKIMEKKIVEAPKQESFKIVIGINSLAMSSYPAYSNHIGLFYRLGIWANKGGHEICLVNPARMSIDRMRNLCARTAIQIGAKYLLFIDDDVLVPPENLLDKLIAVDADIVAGDVIIRGYPFDHMGFTGDRNGLYPISDLAKEIKKQKSDILTVGAVGFSLCLIKTEVLKKVSQPWFMTGYANTEDIAFCLKAKDFIPDLKVRFHTGITCGHILWEEIITSGNRNDYKKYFETQNPLLLVEAKAEERRKKVESGDRGIQYLTKMKQTMRKVKVSKNA